MSYPVPMSAAHFLLPLCVLLAACTATPSVADWQLQWSDEFAHDGTPNPALWDCEVGRVRNGELQHYTRDRLANARVENGHLVIEARREDFAGATFTSASLITLGRAAFTHARIEVSARLPRGRGVWPAIWLLGTNRSEVGWPACGEIDVMEFVGFEPDAVHQTVHTAKYNHMHRNSRGTRVSMTAPSDGFHIYAVEWDRERMLFSIDGSTTFTVTNDNTGTESWPFDAPFYLLLNVAVGGTWGGQHGVDESVFPQQMAVDWVRVWARR